MTELQLIEGKPKIFAISSEEMMLSQIEDYVENYDYEYVGSASEKNEIFKKIDELSPNLIFLDTEEEGLDLLETASDLEIFNVPVIIIVGALFDDTIDKLLMSNPYNYLLKPLDEDELQRAMAVSLKKHEQNILSVQTAQSRIQEKNTGNLSRRFHNSKCNQKVTDCNRTKNEKTLEFQGFDWWSVGGSNCIRHFQSLKTVENQGGQTRCPKV